MDSVAMDGGLLALVLILLPPRDLVRCQAVCTRWRAVASDAQLRHAAFIRRWQLAGARGEPRTLGVYETALCDATTPAGCFVRPHAVSRGDSLAMLAVRHDVAVSALKRLNNITSEHSLASRSTVYIPVATAAELVAQTVAFQYDPLAKRELIVLHETTHVRDNAQDCATSELAAAARVVAAVPQPSRPSTAPDTGRSCEVMQAKLCSLLGRSLYVDDSTARFYLEDAGGDLKAAMEAFAHDLAWEGTTPGPIRTAPVQRWIEGSAGL